MLIRLRPRLALIVLGSMLLSACATPPLLPTPLPAAASTPTAPQLTPTLVSPTQPAPTATAGLSTPTAPLPTMVPTQTPTPMAVLSDTGPWLVYRDVYGWAVADGINSHLGPIRLAGEAPLSTTLTSAYTNAGALFIAPIGGWFAFYTTSTTASFALTTVHLPDRRSGLSHLELFSDDLQKQVREANADALPDTVKAILFRRPLWSPDGTALAFTGAWETTNAALYVYRPRVASPQRLTDDSEQAALVAWSPDSQWLLYETLAPMVAGQVPVVASLWAVPAAGGAPKKLYDVTSETMDAPKLLGWSPEGEAVMFMPDVDGGDNAVCLALNLVTGQAATWQRGDFGDTAYDPQTGTLALIPISINGPDSILLAHRNGKPSAVPETVGKLWPSIEWLPAAGRFFAHGVDDVILLEPNVALTHLPDEAAQQTDERPAVSPDGKWLTFWNEKSGVRLYSADGTLMRTISVGDAIGTWALAWQPDSSGFYLVSDEGKLYSATLPEGQPVVSFYHLDPSVKNMLPGDPANLAWVLVSK
jgi:hypothetical protein